MHLHACCRLVLDGIWFRSALDLHQSKVSLDFQFMILVYQKIYASLNSDSWDLSFKLKWDSIMFTWTADWNTFLSLQGYETWVSAVTNVTRGCLWIICVLTNLFRSAVVVTTTVAVRRDKLWKSKVHRIQSGFFFPIYTLLLWLTICKR